MQIILFICILTLFINLSFSETIGAFGFSLGDDKNLVDNKINTKFEKFLKSVLEGNFCIDVEKDTWLVCKKETKTIRFVTPYSMKVVFLKGKKKFYPDKITFIFNKDKKLVFLELYYIIPTFDLIFPLDGNRIENLNIYSVLTKKYGEPDKKLEKPFRAFWFKNGWTLIYQLSLSENMGIFLLQNIIYVYDKDRFKIVRKINLLKEQYEKEKERELMRKF